MAYRLQTSAPELMDLSTESARTLDRYGIKSVKEANFARNCLLARRLVEPVSASFSSSTRPGTNTAT